MKNAYRSRRLALQALCCLDVQGEKAMTMALNFIRDGNESLEFIEKAEFMTQRVMASLADCDELIQSKSRKWSLGRIALVDRNILRLAVWELIEAHAPRKVVIDQAVRLAKEFSTEHSGGFVNGVLDAVSRQLDPATAADEPCGDDDACAEHVAEVESPCEDHQPQCGCDSTSENDCKNNDNEDDSVDQQVK